LAMLRMREDCLMRHVAVRDHTADSRRPHGSYGAGAGATLPGPELAL
jgi:hypothetical protein